MLSWHTRECLSLAAGNDLSSLLSGHETGQEFTQEMGGNAPTAHSDGAVEDKNQVSKPMVPDSTAA